MKRILLLEDEEVLGRIYKKKLEEADFFVRWAQNSKEFQDCLKEKKSFDIALLDQSLHGDEKTGIALLPLVQQHSPEAHIFMLSNYSSFELEREAKELGAEGFFVKIDTKPKILIEILKKLKRK